MRWGEPPPGPIVLESDDSPSHPMAAWFAHMRSERSRGRLASDGSRTRRRAVITIIHDEPVFLPIWLRYYSRFFAPEDLYVIDTDPPRVPAHGEQRFVRVPAPHDGLDNLWMVARVEELQHNLLGRYDVVVVCDVDEIVAPSPRWGTLSEYLDVFGERWVNCLGYEVLHMREREPPLRTNEPILAQRRYWYFNAGYNKPSIATVPMYWRPGFHGREDFHMNLDPDLRLIHLHRVDYDICRKRHRTRAGHPWASRDAQEGWGAQNFIVEEPEFGRWFYEDSSFAGYEIRVEEIPAAWRGAF